MTVRKALDWVRVQWFRAKKSGLPRQQIRSQSLTGTMKLLRKGMSGTTAAHSRTGRAAWAGMKAIPAKWKTTNAAKTAITRVESESAAPSSAPAQRFGDRLKQIPFREGIDWLRTYRLRLLSAAGALGVATAVTAGANHYIEINTVQAYHVLMNGQEVGIVSNPQVVEDFKLSKIKELEQNNPNVHMVPQADGITFRDERAFKIKSDDQAVLSRLDSLIVSHPVGVQLKVDGKLIGILKDKDTAQQVLDQIKSKYLPADDKDAGKVSILSAPKELNPGESVVQQVDFVQKVDLDMVDIKPEELANPDDILNKLQTGDVQPTKYTIEKGDCVSCIAKKFGISRQVIYQNNPWIVDDMIKIGQVLDLTVLQPTLSVRTVEKVVENQEIQYDTDYITDDTLRAGVTQTITPGKNGLKKVTFELTKVNGFMEDEQMLDEEIITEPVKATAKKGTKVILGEGSGKFAWPVLSSSVSSGFGDRWGKFHKGVDLTSGNKSILAADNGKVVYAGYTADYGNHIILDHMNGYRTLYGHLSQMNVTVGKIVEKGEKIGVMGSTGDSTGVHLHFEIQNSGIPENPLKYLNR